jgi:homoserine kinase
MENGALGWNIRFWAFYFALSKGRDTADKIAKAMSVYDEMKLPMKFMFQK